MLMVKCAKKRRLNALDTVKSEWRPNTVERSVFLSCLESGSQSGKLSGAYAASAPDTKVARQDPSILPSPRLNLGYPLQFTDSVLYRHLTSDDSKLPA